MTEKKHDLKYVNPNILLSRQTPAQMSSSKIKRIKKNIKNNNFDDNKPILVANVNGKLIILDGHHRVKAVRELKLKQVPIIIELVSDEQGEQLLIEVAEAQTYNQY